MASGVLNFVFCLTLLLPLGEGQILPECDPFIRLPSGSKTNISIAVYLNSSTLLPCSKNISIRLKDIFQAGPDGAQTRSDVVNIVGDLCSAYVNLTSLIFFKNLSQAICNEQSLSNQTLKQNFCTHVDMEKKMEIPDIKIELERFKQIHYHFKNLTSLGGNCEDKCRRKNSGVLCNAYYSMALLLSHYAHKGMLGHTKLIIVSGSLTASNFSTEKYEDTST